MPLRALPRARPHRERAVPRVPPTRRGRHASRVDAPPARVTLRPIRGGDLQVLRAAAEKCDVWSSLQDTEAEVLHIAFDFEPALLRCVAERIDELHLAAERGEAAEVRRRACAAALNEAALPELMKVVVWLGHEELMLVVQQTHLWSLCATRGAGQST